MQRKDIARTLAQRCDLEIPFAAEIVNEVIDIISEALVEDEGVYLRGFGTFKTVIRKERVARNISAGTSLIVPAHKKVVFKASDQLLS